MLKFILCLLLTLTSTYAFSQDVNHIRFWRGYKQEQISYDTFLSNISSTLIPMTVDVGANKGLNAYLPAILPEEKAAFLPDEVAILTYETLEKYNALTKTPEWESYGPLHYADGYFARATRGKKSGSLVVGNELPKDLTKPFAYKISNIDGQYKKYNNSMVFLVFNSTDLNTKTACLKTLDLNLKEKLKDTLSSVILFDVEYVAILSTTAVNASKLSLNKESIACFKVAHETNYIKDTKIESRVQSVNFQF